jgi:hypothetical protein
MLRTRWAVTDNSSSRSLLGSHRNISRTGRRGYGLYRPGSALYILPQSLTHRLRNPLLKFRIGQMLAIYGVVDIRHLAKHRWHGTHA